MGKFVIRKTDADYHLALKAANGEIITTSEKYTTKAACKKRYRERQEERPRRRGHRIVAQRVYTILIAKKEHPRVLFFRYENNLASGFFLHIFPQIAAPEAILRVRREVCRNGPR